MATGIEITDPLLVNLQANIIKGHGRNFARHLFFRLDPLKSDLARQWIAEFAMNRITSAKKQLEDSRDLKLGEITDGGTVFTLSLSSSGYDALALTAFKPTHPPFVNGMKSRAGFLGDDLNTWDENLQGTVDLLIIIADDNSQNLHNTTSDIILEVSSFATLLLDQKGNVLKMKGGTGIEHFGYADGISQPIFLADEIKRQENNSEWKDATDTSLLLLPDPGSLDDSGSFIVFRKLEQNVKAFKDAEGDNPPTPTTLPLIKDVRGAGNEKLAGAMIVGRFENSVPVVKSSIGFMPNPPVVTNDFDYRDDLTASKCPFHSHIRLMNPRNGDTAAGDQSSHRITRRGIPYDDVNRISEHEIENITDEMLKSNQPEKGVGLLFMCYQSNIQNQFETIQRFWANQGNISGHLVGGEDSLISQGLNPPKTLPLQWGQPAQSSPFSFDGFVTMKGGEYFFTPSIGFLRGLGNIL